MLHLHQPTQSFEAVGNHAIVRARLTITAGLAGNRRVGVCSDIFKPFQSGLRIDSYISEQPPAEYSSNFLPLRGLPDTN